MEFAAEDAVEFWPSFPGENLPPFTMCRCTLSSFLYLFSWRHTQVRLSNCRQRYGSRENYNSIEREYRIAKRIAGDAGEKKKRNEGNIFNSTRTENTRRQFFTIRPATNLIVTFSATSPRLFKLTCLIFVRIHRRFFRGLINVAATKLPKLQRESGISWRTAFLSLIRC